VERPFFIVLKFEQIRAGYCALARCGVQMTMKVVDIFIWFFAVVAASVAKLQWRCGGPQNLPLSFRAWNASGVLPVPFHYYHPAFDPERLPESVWTRETAMPGIDLRVGAQLNLLRQFRYADELRRLPLHCEPKESFCFFNRMYGPGDAEVLYSVIRHLKPQQMIEIGSGCSTMLANAALDLNRTEGHVCEHICIEPFPEPWLENVKISHLIRQRVETVDPKIFERLGANDILFIDSSHVLRIGGDVQFEYLEVLPRLQPGVFVHVHDIYLPFEYPLSWVRDRKWFWTEQHLVQAFLAFNSAFEVVLSLSYLNAHHREALADAAPVYAQHPTSGPSSLWIRRKLQ
jgi:hypothetical protein